MGKCSSKIMQRVKIKSRKKKENPIAIVVDEVPEEFYYRCLWCNQLFKKLAYNKDYLVCYTCKKHVKRDHVDYVYNSPRTSVCMSESRSAPELSFTS